MEKDNFFEFVSQQDNILHFKCKGFWNKEMVIKHGKKIMQHWQKLLKKFDGQPWIAVPDLSQYLAASAEGRDFMLSMMKTGHKYNLFHSVPIVPQIIQQVTIKLTGKEILHEDYSTPAIDMKEALLIAAKKKEELLSINQSLL